MDLPSLVGFVMGLSSWMCFGCGYAAVGYGFVAMDWFWSWVIGGGVNVNEGLRKISLCSAMRT